MVHEPSQDIDHYKLLLVSLYSQQEALDGASVTEQDICKHQTRHPCSRSGERSKTLLCVGLCVGISGHCVGQIQKSRISDPANLHTAALVRPVRPRPVWLCGCRLSCIRQGILAAGQGNNWRELNDAADVGLCVGISGYCVGQIQKSRISDPANLHIAALVRPVRQRRIWLCGCRLSCISCGFERCNLQQCSVLGYSSIKSTLPKGLLPSCTAHHVATLYMQPIAVLSQGTCNDVQAPPR